eukprot:116720_1
MDDVREVAQNDHSQQRLTKKKSLKINRRPKDDDSGFLERPVKLMQSKSDQNESIDKKAEEAPFKINKRPMHDDSGYLERPNLSHDSHCIDCKHNKKQWFGSDQLTTYCDKEETDYRGCYAVNRIAIVMASAKDGMQTTFDAFCGKELDAGAVYSITSLINDYHHVLEEHDVDLEDIRTFLVDKHGLDCVDSECDYLRRNYRNRTQCSKYDEIQLYETDDAKRQLMNKQLDKIHAYMLHSFDLNYRLTKNEQLQIFGVNTEQKDDGTSTALDVDEDHKEHQEDAYEGETIKQMQKVIEKKRIRMKQLVGEEQILNNKFVTKVVSENTDQKQSDVKKRISTEYSFGFPFKYYERFKHNKWFIHKKHNDLKHELMDNPFLKLCLPLWQNQWDAANAFLECNRTKGLRCSHIALYDEPLSKDTGIEDNAPITAPHVLSLLLYCNCTELCTVFSSTFRRTRQGETDEEVKERNAHFFHWSRLLLETIHLYGIPLTEKSFGKSAYHGVSRIMVFDEMNQRVYGPFSTTSQFNVALQFACHGGMVLTLNRSSDIRHNKYFDCALFSDFSAEAEKLFLNGLLQIDDILHVQSRHSFGKYCRALNVLTSMLSATPVNARIVRKKHASFYLSMMEEGHEPYPDYVEALWHHMVQNIEEVDIDVQLMNVDLVDTSSGRSYVRDLLDKECDKWGFKLLNSFVMMQNGWINLERLCKLLPNLEAVNLVRYRRNNHGDNKLVQSIPLSEQLINRFLEYQPRVPIVIIIHKPNQSEMPMSSFIAKCRETQKGKINKTFVVESGPTSCVVCFGDTPLYQACTNGEDELVLKLLKRDDEVVKASINKAARHSNATPLYVAAHQGHVKCVERMLSIDDVSLNALSYSNENVFMITVAKGYNNIAMMLLDHSDKMKTKCIKHGIIDINHVDDSGDSALHKAVTANNHQIIDALIEHNINTDIQNSKHETALYIACAKQHTEIIDILLKNGKANPDIQDVRGVFPLIKAIWAVYTEGIVLLLKYGADANKINAFEKTNTSATALFYAIKKKTKNTVALLLDAGADPAFIDANGQTYLHVAAAEAQLETLKMLFDAVSRSGQMTKEELTAFVNQKDADGDTALHIASSDDDRKDCVEFLLQNTPCDVNILNNRDRSALFASLASGCNHIAQMLLTAGAKTDIIDTSSKTPLFDAVEYCRNVHLVEAIYNNYLNNTNKKEATNFVNHVDDEGKTALYVACAETKSTECLAYLIKMGAKIDVYDKNGRSLFHAVARGWAGRDFLEIIYDSIKQNWLQDQNKIKAFVNHTDNKYETALFACAHDAKKAKYLLSIGGKIDPRCDINKVDKYKDTILANTASAGCLELVNILLDAGAKINTLNHTKDTLLHQAAQGDVDEHACGLLKAIYNRYLLNTDHASATKFVNLKNKRKETALFNALYGSSDSISCVSFLLSVGAAVCLFNHRGRSPLSIAAAFGQLKSLKCIYNHYLESTDSTTATHLVNCKDKEKKSALFLAAECGYIECIEFLISVGAHTDTSDTDEEGNSILHRCADGGSLKCMKAIYEHFFQNINDEKAANEFVNLRNQNGETAIFMMTHYSLQKDMFKYLHSIGAVFNVFEGVRGRSVLHRDAYDNEIEILQLIYELYLKDTNLLEATKLINAQDFDKETVLHIAVKWNYKTDKVKYLLKNTQCDVNLKNNNGETPLMIAAQKGRTETVNVLLSAHSIKLVDKHGNCEALRLAKQKKKECADAIEERLIQRLSADEATQIIEKYPDNYPQHVDPWDD